MRKSNDYTDDLRRVRSLMIVNSLQKKEDLKARKLIEDFSDELDWEPLAELMIDPEVWAYVVTDRGYAPKLVFCHPRILLHAPAASLYYRGLCGLSLKAIKDYAGSVDSIEDGSSHTPLDEGKALRLAQTYNTFICSIIKNSTDWTLDNGYRTIIATLGITLDGVMRNKVGSIAEDRIRVLILEWLIKQNLVIDPPLTREQLEDNVPMVCTLTSGVTMHFGSDPDITFTKDGLFLAVVEIKGGIDPAGALERYGAATKSFQHAIRVSARCKNFYLAAVYTPEVERRIAEDRLVEKTFDIIRILEDQNAREEFFTELFHHTLRLT